MTGLRCVIVVFPDHTHLLFVHYAGSVLSINYLIQPIKQYVVGSCSLISVLWETVLLCLHNICFVLIFEQLVIRYITQIAWTSS